MANRINMDTTAHLIHAQRGEMWASGDEWFQKQSVAEVREGLELLSKGMAIGGPDNLLYRLAFTALLELVCRRHVHLSQAENDDGG